MSYLRDSGVELFETTLIAFRWTTFLAIIATAVLAYAQGGPVRDASAIAVLQNSVSAMGGSSGWQAVQDWTIAGTVSTNGSSQPASNFSWIGAGTEFRLATNTASTTNAFLSGHGSPARISNGVVSSLNYFVARANPPLYLPGVRLMQELNYQQLTIRYVGAATAHGRPAIQIHVSDDSDSQGSLVTPHEWFFDATSLMPLEVQFRVPPNESPQNYLNGTEDFWQFQVIGGLTVPSQLSLSRGDGSPTRSFVLNSVAFNSGVPQSTFDPPQGGGQ